MTTLQRRAHSHAAVRAAESSGPFSIETLFYGALAVFVALISLTMLGCTAPESEKVEYGPETSATEIAKAMATPLADSDPAQIQLGAFVHMTQVQEIAGGQATSTLADVGQTVTDRQESGTEIALKVVESVISYQSGDGQKASTEYPVYIAKSQAAAATATSPLVRSATVRALNKLEALKAESLRALGSTANATATKVTYHNLQVSEAMEPAPKAVKEKPNCLGLPGCQMKVHRISFDQVLWTADKGDRIHYDLAISPDMPFVFVFSSDGVYLEKPMNKCMTLMIPIGDGNSKTLLKQCTLVVSFRFSVEN